MTMPTLIERAHDDVVGDAPQPDRPQRRAFSADYKLAILAEYDRLTAPGAKGSLLRREGLHSSHIVEWRRAREAGTLHRTGVATPTAKPKPASEAAVLAKATRRAERAEAELAKTKMALEIMGKAHALLEMLAESADCDPKPKN
jgi:transposase-like protein